MIAVCAGVTYGQSPAASAKYILITLVRQIDGHVYALVLFKRGLRVTGERCGSSGVVHASLEAEVPQRLTGPRTEYRDVRCSAI